jgi:threonine aldolase
MENTHNGAGGTVLSLDHMDGVFALAKANGFPVHLDGARLFNAAAVLGVPASEIAKRTDTVCFCLSKGLSAPVGSVLCGPVAVIDKARWHRTMLGGSLRQAGVIAAAGVVALSEMVDRLGEDHVTAKRLADGLYAIDPSITDPSVVETNMVTVDFGKVGRDTNTWSRALVARGVWTRGTPSPVMRLVTHRHVDAADVDRAVEAFAAQWEAFSKKAAVEPA